MDLTLTVVNAATGARADVQIRAPAGTPATAVHARLREVVCAAAGAPLTVGGRPVPSDGDVEDCGLRPGDVVEVGHDRSREPPTAHALELAVTSGPDAGRCCPLPVGSHLIGRSVEATVTIHDRSISRRHLRIDVGEHVTATDLDSANHSLVDGEPLPSNTAVAVAAGTTLRLGNSEIRLQAAAAGPGGSEVIHRSPRFASPDPPVEVMFPTPPAVAIPARVPVLAGIAPLVAGLAICLVLRQWQFLAFTALSPVMVFGQAASDRRSVRRGNRAAQADHREASARAGQRLAAELAAEAERRRGASPSLPELTTAARSRSPLLWQRAAGDSDALLLRLGRGDLPARVLVTGTPDPAIVTNVPVCCPLADVGVLGVAGPPEATTSLARALLTQAATLHSPADLELVVLAPAGAGRWGWVRWLPHVVGTATDRCHPRLGFDADQIARQVVELTAAEQPRTARRLVLVDAAAAPAACAALRSLLATQDDSTSVIWCATTIAELPSECRAVVTLTGQHRLDAQLGLASAAAVSAVPDLMAIDVAAATARALAPLRPSTGPSRTSVPATVRWTAVNRIDLQDREAASRALAESWQRGPSTRITLGRGSDTVVSVDLDADGPHALVAGTTGSGKSELLLSMVASLAAANRPDQLALLLVDHKGGAAFGPLVDLPHTVGVVTDLDTASTSRALLSLGAELRHREARLAAAGAADLGAFLATDPAEPLPRLVLVVDEFATVAEEQPDFIGGLVGIAQRGRSLGVHLVLATQRPDGAVSADIRANTRLRICLGVAREHESRDVIDCPDAVTISRTTPGRGYLRVGPGELQLFQTAQIGGVRTATAALSVELSPAATLGDPPIETPYAGSESDLDVLIDAAKLAAQGVASASVSAPWLPELPARLWLSELPTPPVPTEVAWGRLDLPAAGRQPPLTVDPAVGGTTVIAGTARCGRTTAAVALVTAFAARCGPDALHMWGIDAAAGLAPIATFPHCGSVVPSHDPERTQAVIDHIADEVARRRRDATVSGPALVLVIDSWDGLASAAGTRAPELLDRVLRLAADGPAAGLHLIVTGDRGLLTGRLAASATERIALRLADPSDLMLLGMSVRDLPRDQPAGRGVRGSDLALLQIALPDAAASAAARRWSTASPAVRRFAPLPDRVELSRLPDDGTDTGAIRLGLEAGTLDSVAVERVDLPGFAIVGRPGSGRSTALLLIASQLCGQTVAVSCPADSPLDRCPGTVRLPRDDQDQAVAILDSLDATVSDGLCLIVDDVDQLPEGPLWDHLDTLTRAGRRPGATIVASAATDAVAGAFRGPVAQLRRARSGLLLGGVSRHDGELLGIRCPPRSGLEDPPGRGWLVVSGRGRRLQLADPEPVSV